MSEYQIRYNEYLSFTEKCLNEYLEQLNCNPILKEGMSYSVNAGGKRVRPVMFFAMLDHVSFELCMKTKK